MDHSQNTLTRWYIDTRPLTSSTTTTSLPLLETLQPTDQETVRKYYHLKDKHMSLASNLLKYLFIHRTCRIPWETITISRTAAPHRRPCFIPTPTQKAQNPTPPTIEFNVSHQASLVALAGTTAPTTPEPGSSQIPTPTPTPTPPQVGIDITCVNERQGRASGAGVEPRTLAALRNYVDIFTEVFSAREIDAMKRLHGAPTVGIADGRPLLVEYGYRLFYSYWALKEAYIKMTGEALLAPWLRDLEFADVVAPAAEAAGEFGRPYKGVRTTLDGKLVEDVRVEVVALEADYLIATAARGAGVGRDCGAEGGDSWLPFEKVDIEKDIRPCATGSCNCLR